MAQTGFQLADGAAELYEKNNVPTMSRPAAEHILKHIDIGSTDQVLDLACGTDIMARLIATKYKMTGGITGLDFNDDMHRLARSLSSKAGFPIEWRQGIFAIWHSGMDNLIWSFVITACNSFPTKPSASPKSGGCWALEDASPSPSGAPNQPLTSPLPVPSVATSVTNGRTYACRRFRSAMKVSFGNLLMMQDFKRLNCGR